MLNKMYGMSVISVLGLAGSIIIMLISLLGLLCMDIAQYYNYNNMFLTLDVKQSLMNFMYILQYFIELFAISAVVFISIVNRINVSRKRKISEYHHKKRMNALGLGGDYK